MRLALLFLLLASPLSGQRILDPDTCFTCRDSFEHFGSSAALDVSARVLFPKWKSWQRVALTGGLIGAVWEAGQTDVAYHNGLLGRPGQGYGLKDWACDILGAWVAESVWSALKKL